MFTTEMPSLAHTKSVTVEEYMHLKRRLFNLRRQYVSICRPPFRSELSESSLRKARQLERRIQTLEGELARSELTLYDREPHHRLREFLSEIRAACVQLRAHVATWRVAIRHYIAARFIPHQT